MEFKKRIDYAVTKGCNKIKIDIDWGFNEYEVDGVDLIAYKEVEE